MAIELYAHNAKTYKKMTTMFEKSNRVGIVQPTGTGKSFIILKWIEDHPNEKFVVLSPSLEIFMQFVGYARATGDEALLDSVQMLSYQTLSRMSDEEIRKTHAQKIVVDEFHRTGAELWGPALQKLLEANPNAQVLGASATPVRYLDDTRDMASELFDRHLAVEMTLGEAVRRNILPTPKYVPVWYDIDGKMAQYQRDISKIKNKEERKELEKKLEHMKRRLENAYGAEKIFEKNMPNDHGKFIVFCRDKGHLEEMQKIVPQWLRGVNKTVRRYVSISAQEDKDIQLQAFARDNDADALKLLFTIDRLNEGVHIKGIDGVVMLRPTVSPIIYLQQLGRALSAGGKTPLVFDMVNNYQNVQVPLGTGETRNVFDFEFHDGEANIGDFRIFEDMIGFSSLFEQLEDMLYLSNDDIWENNLHLYVDFKKEFGFEPLQTSIYMDKNIGKWCNAQRVAFLRGQLPVKRMQRLLDVGFVFDGRALYNTQLELEWQHKLNVYITFIKEFGYAPSNSDVYNGVDIGRWCKQQRDAFREGKLSDDRIQKLLDAGFIFDVREDSWKQKFNLYVAYIKEFGNKNLFSAVYKGFNLGAWLASQKILFYEGKLSNERLNMLLDAGFDFSNKYESKWQSFFDLYVAYKKEFGCEPENNALYHDMEIGKWCKKQRTYFVIGRLSNVKIQKLLSVGFILDGSVFEQIRLDQEWNRKLQAYLDYKNKYGKEPPRKTIYNGIDIRTWCDTQRKAFKKGNLSAERIEKLSNAGFPFVLKA